MARVKNSIIAERKLHALCFILLHQEESAGYIASTRDMAKSLGLSEAQLRGVKKSLVEAGLVRVVSRTYPNGGTAENAYFLTPAGIEALSYARSRR
ncbi:hypothetical protein [Eggerthella timonensis]|uniref:hypothetical protein n=1 Tax=Eggerthella timonensis TaxID=1871008 RepID=UPI000C772F2E|nr:hypothetical protein [Eggerthella timonensis]